MSRFRRVKKDVRAILSDPEWQSRLSELEAWPPGVVVPPLFPCVWTGMSRALAFCCRLRPDCWPHGRRIHGKARVLMRTCMWHMNEESGNLGWGIPHFMAEAMVNDERIAKEFHKILASYIFCDEACDGNFLDHVELRRDVFWGLARLAESRPELVAHSERFLIIALDEEDPYNRAYAARALGLIDAVEAREKIESMQDDATEIRTFRDGDVVDVTVGRLAGEALAAMG